MSGRRARGDGSIYFDADRGCWRGAIDVGRDPRTGRRVRRKTSGRTKTECQRKLDRLRAEKGRTGTVGPQNVTVEHVVRDLLANPPARWNSHITIDGNNRRGERIIRALGTRKTNSLTAADVEAFLRGLAGEGMATSTIAKYKGLLVEAIRRAQRDGLVPGLNVADLVETPRGTKTESRSLTPAGLQALFGLTLSAWWRAWLVTAIMCGLRPGELLGLTWDDVDLNTGLIRVRHCLKPVRGKDGKGRLALEELKTEASKRTLQTPVLVIAALRALHTFQAAERLRLGPLYGGDAGDLNLVFCGEAGQPKWQSVCARSFKALCEQAGIGTTWQLREQRHTFVSLLSDAGVNIERIADAAGHVNANVTRGTYRHQLADTVADAAVAMDRIFQAAP